MMKKFSLLVAVLWTAMTSFAATYVPFTGTLTEGDYLITYGQYAMGNTITKNRMDCVDFTQSEFVADPDEKMVWHIAFVEGKDNVVTLYNAAAGKYAAGNGTKNQIKLVDEVSDDFAQWTLTATDGGFEFVNVGNQAKGVNSNLRNNSTFGFACYSAQTGGVLALYAEGAYTAPQTRTLTFDAGVWNEAGAVFAAWVWGDGMTAQWTGAFTAAEKQNIYTAEIPYEATGMIFFRLPAGTTVVAGTEDYNTYANSAWDKTGDETILLTDPYFTITDRTVGTWGTPVVYSTCADVNAVSANTEMTLGEVTVVFAKGSNIYVQDATGITLVYNNNYSTLKAGDRVSGIAGTAKLYNGLPELAATTAADQLVVTEGTAPVIPDATAAITAADVNKVFMLRHMQMPQGAAFTTSVTNIAVTFYGTEIQLRNNWKEAFTFDESREYTMLGCVAVYKGTVQVYVTDFEAEYADDETLPFTFDANIWSTDDQPLFAAWTWAEGGEGQWTNFFKHVDGTIYQGEMPAKHNNLIFVRVNPEAANATMSWDYVYNQTGNLTFNAEDPYFTITGWGEGENPRSTGVWGTPEPAPTVVTVEEALRIIAALEDKQITDEKYTVTGYVAAITSAYSEKYGDITFTLGNSADATDLITVYQAIAEDAEVAKALAAGDKVTVTGNLQKYGTTPEFAKGASFVLVEKAPAPQVEAGIYLAGSMTSWADNMIKLVPGTEDQLYTTTVALEANAAEEFKIVVVGEDGSMTWYGLQKEGTVTETVSGWWLYTTAQEGGDAKNIGLKTAGKGEYTFIYKDNENHELSVTYPEVTPVTPVDGITVSKTVDELVAEQNLTVSSGSDATVYTALALDDVITVSTTGEPNCGAIYGTTDGQWRLYQNKAGDVTIAAAEGYIIKSVKLTYGISNTGVLMDVTGATVASEEVVAVNASSVNFIVGNSKTATNGQVRITAFEVVYDKDGDTPQPQPEMYTFYIETSKMMGEGANNFAAWTWKEGGVDAAFSNFFMRLDVATMEAIGKQMGAPEGTDFSKYTVYAATVPAGMDSVIIVRFDEPVNEPAWTVSAAQTVDLKMIYSDMPFLVITGFDEEVKKFNAVWGLPEDVDDPVYSFKAQVSEAADDWDWTDLKKDDESGLYIATFEYFGGTGIDFGTRENASFITFEVLGLTEAPVAGDIIRIIFDGQQSLRANFIQHQTPETVFYIKAQMSDNGNDWAWNAMQKNDDEVYTLDLTYFGGIGVNFSADKQEGDESLVTFKSLGIEPVAGDVIRFTVNEAGALVAENLGHEAPCVSEYGIMLNNEFMQAVANEAAANEYMLIGVELAENDEFTLYDNCSKSAWTVALDEASVEGIELVTVDEVSSYVVRTAGTYDLYIKLIQDNDQLYIGKHEVVETKYYIKAQMSENANDWAWTEIQRNDDGMLALNLKYFGGTGVNFGTEQKEGDESLVTFETLGIEPVVYDVIRYTVSETGALVAEIVGHEAPCVSEYGIMLNGNFMQAAINEAAENEYMLIGVEFAENDKFTLYDNCDKGGAFIVPLEEASVAGIVLENDEYVVNAAGTYDLYIKLIPHDNKLYIGLHQEPETHYYIKSQMSESETDWGWNEMQKDNDGNYILDLSYFGGNGVNFTADLSVENPEYITFETLNIAPEKYDIIRYTYNGETLTAAIVGHEEPCVGQYGIMFNGDFMQAVLNEAAENEYMLIGVEFAENDKFTLYDNCDKGGAFIVPLEEASVAGIVLENDEYVVNAAGTYDLYIKLIQDNDQLYIELHQEPETHYYIKSQVSENANDWAWTEMQKNDDEVYTIDLTYFGGTGVNFGTEQKEGDESLVTFKTLGIEPAVYDVIRYTVSETGALAAEIIGHDAPCVNEFGIMFNNEFLQGELNPANAQEYMLLGMKFAENDEFTLYNNCAQEGWVVALDEASTAGIVIENEKYVVKAAGTYDLYIKIFDGQSGLYIEKQNDKCEEYGLILNGVKQYLDYADVKVYEDKQGELVVNVKIFQLDYTFSVGDAFTLFSECSEEINAALANIDLSKIDGIEYDAATKTYKVTKAGAYSIFIKMNDEDLAEVTIEEDKSTTAIDNAQVEMMDGKFVRDGQLFIIREGVIYNAQGAVIRK